MFTNYCHHQLTMCGGTIIVIICVCLSLSLHRILQKMIDEFEPNNVDNGVVRNFIKGVHNCVIVSKQCADFLIPSLATAVDLQYHFLLKILRIFLTGGGYALHAPSRHWMWKGIHWAKKEANLKPCSPSICLSVRLYVCSSRVDPNSKTERKVAES